MTNEISTNSAKAWWLAARPKTLTAAAMPVLIGCAIALTADSFQWTPAILCLLFAFLMQIDANLINDLFDYKKGSDRQDRLGPERACAQGWITIPAMQRGILITTTACLALDYFFTEGGSSSWLDCSVCCLPSYTLPGPTRLPIMDGATCWYCCFSDLFR